VESQRLIRVEWGDPRFLKTLFLSLFLFLSFTNYANLWISVFYLFFLLAWSLPLIRTKIDSRVWIGFFAILAIAALTGILAIDAFDPTIEVPGVLSAFSRYDPLKYFPSESSLLMRSIGFLKVGLAFLVVGFETADSNDRRPLLVAFEAVFRTFVLFWFLQSGIYYLTGVVLDPSGAGRFLGYSGGGMIFRGTGFLNEPGTYANVMYLMAVIRFLIRGKRLDLWNSLLILSLMASFSLFGWFYSMLLLAVLLKWTQKTLVATVVAAVLGMVLFGGFIESYMAHRLDREVESSYSLATKFWAYESWQSKDLWRQFWGSWGWNDCACLYNDSSLAFVVLNEFGLIALLGLLIFVGRNLIFKRFNLFLMLSGMLFLKSGVTQPALGIFLGFFLGKERLKHGV
jgi:hypothetical protein